MKILLATKERKEHKNKNLNSLCSLRSFLAILLSFFYFSSANAEEKFPDIGKYNQGHALYRDGDFQGSEKLFGEAAALTQNEKLKQKALYNRGTALLASCTGDSQVAPEKQLETKLTATKQAIDLFEEALQLEPSDLAAKQNLERAINLKKQLEQKKQEQEKQKQQDQKKDSKDKQDDEKKQDEKKKDQQEQQKQEPSDKSDKSDPSDQKEQQEQQQQQPQNQEQDQKEGQQQQPQQPQPAQPQQQAGEMSEEEAQQLLDAMKQNEKDQRTNLRPYLGQPVRVDKDW